MPERSITASIRQDGKTLNPELTDSWKEGLARLVRTPPFSRLMLWAMHLVIPRQRIGVALVTFNAREEVLLLRHVFHPAAPWGLPGGWLGRRESPADGLVREVREETGLDVRLGPPAHVSHGTSPAHIVMAYLGWVHPGPLRLSHEIIEARWFSPGRLPSPLFQFTRQAIAAGLELNRALERPSHDPAAQGAQVA